MKYLIDKILLEIYGTFINSYEDAEAINKDLKLCFFITSHWCIQSQKSSSVLVPLELFCML